MNTELYTPLKFDTELFGFKVAKLARCLSIPQLKAALLELKSRHFSLAYWQTARSATTQYAEQSTSALLASEQMIFRQDLSIQKLQEDSEPINYYPKAKPTPEMEDLALQIGALSRFGRDPNFTLEAWQLMYRTWITNATLQTVADATFIQLDSETQKIIGMIVLKITGGKCGEIVLLAVAPTARGKGVGTKLIKQALCYFNEQKCQTAQVVTQKTNLPACALYQKCGFTLQNCDHFYHFWL